MHLPCQRSSRGSKALTFRVLRLIGRITASETSSVFGKWPSHRWNDNKHRGCPASFLWWQPCRLETNNFLTHRSSSTAGDEGGYAAFFLPLTELGNPAILASGCLSPKVDSKVSFPLVISVKAISAARRPGANPTSGRWPRLNCRTRCETMLMRIE